MTGAAEFALVHLLHHPPFITIAGADNRIMTIAAPVTLFLVHLVVEVNIAGTCLQFITNCLEVSRMTFKAVGLDPKCGVVVVTGPT